MRNTATILAGDVGPRAGRLATTCGGGRARRCVLSIIATALLCTFPCSAGRAPPDAAASRKYAVIAAFLYNFFLYVDWPQEAVFQDGPLRIGVLGENPFGEALHVLEKRNVEGRAIEVSIFDSVEAITATHILFLPMGVTEHLPEVRRQLRGQAVLTVGEADSFTRLGGVVRFFETGDAQRIGVEINQAAAAALNLRIRAKLLRLATLVEHPLPPIAP